MFANRTSGFEQAILPHLDAAYNLARWLMRDQHDADDAVQDAYVRALRFFEGFRGGDGRVWLLAIVRNVCFSRLKQNRAQELHDSFDDELHGHGLAGNPETALLKNVSTESLQRALEKLPEAFREVVVMRELDELSYKEIAGITGVPIGTVMSRLTRARRRLQHYLMSESGGAA